MPGRCRPVSPRRCADGWPGCPVTASGCWTMPQSSAETSMSACWRQVDADGGEILALLDEATQAGVLAGTSPALAVHPRPVSGDDPRWPDRAGSRRDQPGGRPGVAGQGRGHQRGPHRRASAGRRSRGRSARAWSTRSSPRVRPPRASGMTTPAPTTCARCTSWTNIGIGHRSGPSTAVCSNSPRPTSGPAMSGLAMQRYRELALLGRDTARCRDCSRAGRSACSRWVTEPGPGTPNWSSSFNWPGRLAGDQPESLALQSQRVTPLWPGRCDTVRPALPDPRVIPAAHRAVELAVASGDARALALARLALQDSMWTPGQRRRPPSGDRAQCSTPRRSCGDRDLVAEAHLLRAAALIELGDPAGRVELLLAYTAMAAELGHARGRWGALTRRATFAQIAGQTERSGSGSPSTAYELGLAIGIPDAVGCFCSLRWSLVALGGADVSSSELGRRDGHGHGFRGPAVADVSDVRGLGSRRSRGRGRNDMRRSATSASSTFPPSTGWRRWPLRRSCSPSPVRRRSGRGPMTSCAPLPEPTSSSAAARPTTPPWTITSAHWPHPWAIWRRLETHFRAALAMHERLGAAGWARLSEDGVGRPVSEGRLDRRRNEFRFAATCGRLRSMARRSSSRTPRDFVTSPFSSAPRDETCTSSHLIGQAQPPAPEPTRCSTTAPRPSTGRGWPPWPRRSTKPRTGTTPTERRACETNAKPCSSTIAAATGLGGRPRRLGDETERARKTVSARVRDALSKIDRVHPTLAAHLRGALQMGTMCSYAPAERSTWDLT